MKIFFKRLLKTIILITCICASLIILIELILSSSLMTRTVNKIAAEYVDGDLKFGDVSVSIFRNFPSLTLTMNDFSVTYPADRFNEAENKGVQGHLMYHGCGQEADTLASFSRFSTSIHILPLMFGSIDIPEVELVRPRIFIHRYDEDTANWMLFRTDSGQDDGSAEGQEGTVQEEEEAAGGKDNGMPRINIGKIRLKEHPHIVYTDCCDTVFAMIDVKSVGFNGRLTTGQTSRNRIGLRLDSMFIAGRAATDTIAFGLSGLKIREHRRRMDVEAQAKALLATRAFGRLNIPIDISGAFEFPKDTVPAVNIDNLKAEIAAIPLTGNASLRFLDSRTAVKGTIGINKCRVNDVISGFIRNFIPETEKITTDAEINLIAECDGDYIHATGKLPAFRASLTIPESTIRHSGIEEEVTLHINVTAEGNKKGRIDLNVGDMQVRTAGFNINGNGSALDIMSSDPLLKVDGTLHASIDSLLRFIPDSLEITARGQIDGSLKGQARLSHMNIYNFSNADLNGKLNADRIFLKIPSDTITVSARKLMMAVGPEIKTSRRDSTLSFRLIGLTGSIGQADINYKNKMKAKGQDIEFAAKSSSSAERDTSKIGRLGGNVSAKSLAITDITGTNLKLNGTSNSFQVVPKRDNPKVPVLSFNSSNKSIMLQANTNRMVLSSASVKAKASLNTVEKRQKRQNFIDSLAKVYPDVPKDSLFSHMKKRRPGRHMPTWIKEDDFKKQDPDLRLDRNLAKYFREWDLDGNLNIGAGILMTPYFPLINSIKGLGIGFNNDMIAIDSLNIISGTSSIEAEGSLTGLKRALLGNGKVMLNLDVSSDRINANELLTAYSKGASFNPASFSKDISETSDEEFLEMVTEEMTDSATAQALIIIPSNVMADISLTANGITYSDLEIDRLTSDIVMKDRCVQITNTMATSNIGDVGFEGFYATRSKKDIQAGFSFSCTDITADKAIALMPSVDTIMPLLKSFSGNLDCEVAATASLDTNMNIVMPSVNGVLRISGDDLSISDSPLFTSLAKKLKFNDQKKGKIKHMNVEGVIKDNIMEIFPFVLSLDRYTLALSGKQNFDMSYRYHASIIKSPLLIKVGVDLYGKDFDHMKFKICKAKYRSEDVPAFSTVIDDTRINLVEAIHDIFEKGVEAAVKENRKMEAINALKKKIGYVNAADQEVQELSEEEKIQFENITETTKEKDEQSGIH